MAKRGRKKTVKESKGGPKPDPDPQPSLEDKGFEEKQRLANEREVERRITAIKAISNAEVDNLLLRLRLLRSYFNSEQLRTPVLRFFEENMPNLSLVKNEKYQLYEVEWKEKDALNYYLHGDILPTTGGLEFSTKSAKENLLKATSLNFTDFVLGEQSEIRFQELRNSLLTPGASSHRSSVGLTPKSLRLPKKGELLMSIHGSPLGFCKEENLEAIHESEDGSQGKMSS